MSITEISELEKRDNELALRKVAGETTNIEINERTLVATREEFTKKGLVVSQEED